MHDLTDKNPQQDAAPEQAAELSTAAIIAALCGVALMSFIANKFLVPWLWGPYATLFASIGSDLPMRAGVFFGLVVLPIFMLVLVLFPNPNTGLVWRVVANILALTAIVGCVLGVGRYVHTRVATAGVENAKLYVADKYYGGQVELIPEHIQAAIRLSFQLSRDGKTPWMPLAWHRVAWPEKEIAEKPVAPSEPQPIRR